MGFKRVQQLSPVSPAGTEVCTAPLSCSRDQLKLCHFVQITAFQQRCFCVSPDVPFKQTNLEVLSAASKMK